MKRLTTRCDGRPALAQGIKERFTEPSLFFMLLNRLAAYEDTGLSPETVNDLVERFSYVYRTVEGLDIVDPVHFGAFVDRVKHWAQAEKDGRLVVQKPPFPGDTIWIIERDEYEEPIEISWYMFFAFVGRAAIVSSFINDSETLDETVEYHIDETMNNFDTDLSVFPKNDCYLTREEAEAALKKREEADNEANS